MIGLGEEPSKSRLPAAWVANKDHMRGARSVGVVGEGRWEKGCCDCEPGLRGRIGDKTFTEISDFGGSTESSDLMFHESSAWQKSYKSV